jgi:hypothetical protein
MGKPVPRACTYSNRQTLGKAAGALLRQVEQKYLFQCAFFRLRTEKPRQKNKPPESSDGCAAGEYFV